MDALVHETEACLVDEFCEAIEMPDQPWGSLKWMSEFGYVRGRTDIIAVDGEGRVIAFEAKLSRWRDAMHQAYRNTCFAHESYVLLPEPVARRASAHVHEFKRRAVGICYVSAGQVVVCLPARSCEPIQPSLSHVARLAIGGTEHGKSEATRSQLSR